MRPTSYPVEGAWRATIILTLFALTAPPSAAQGPSVDPTSQALWFVGVVFLGLVIAYGMMQNRSRITRAEKQPTGEATKNLYAKEERDREQ